MTDNDYGKILEGLHDKILNDEEMLRKVDHPELYALGMCTTILNQQKAEIERLTEENKKQKIILDGIEDAVHPLPFETDYDKAIKQAKSEAIREYVTKYKDYIKNFTGCFNPSIGFTVNLDSVLNAADFVADEMVGAE